MKTYFWKNDSRDFAYELKLVEALLRKDGAEGRIVGRELFRTPREQNLQQRSSQVGNKQPTKEK